MCLPLSANQRARDREREKERERKREREGEWNFWPSVACRKKLYMTTTSFEAEKITS